MSLTAWNGRVAAQTDADSPVDQPLMDGYRLDLDHLREVLYGNPSGGFFTPAIGHKHDGTDSKKVSTVDNLAIDTAQINTNAVTAAKIAADAVGASELQTQFGSAGTTALSAGASYTPAEGVIFITSDYGLPANSIETRLTGASTYGGRFLGIFWDGVAEIYNNDGSNAHNYHKMTLSAGT